MRGLRGFLSALAVVGLALLATAAALLATGESPWHLLLALLRGAFGTRGDFARTLAGATPLVFTGLAVAIPFRAGLFNIGAEGQLVLAGFVAGVVGVVGAGLPPLVLLPLAVVCAVAAGALWAALAGLLRAKLSVHEVIATILLNFLAFHLVAFVFHDPGTGLMPGMEPKTANVPDAIRLPEVLPGVGAGLLFAIGLAALADLLLFRSRAGLALRAAGGNPRAAEAAGIPRGRAILVAMTAGGGFAALAGVQQVLGVHGAYLEGFSPGFGFTGIAVALLGANRPLGVVLAALFFSVLRSGAFAMDALAGIPREATGFVEVLVILLVAAERIRESILPRRAVGKEAA